MEDRNHTIYISTHYILPCQLNKIDSAVYENVNMQPIELDVNDSVNDRDDGVKLDDTLNDTLNGTLNGTLNDTLNDTLKNLSELQRSILNEILKKPSITFSELGDKLHKSRMTIVRAADSLKELGLLIRKGSKKTGLWVVDVNLEEES